MNTFNQIDPAELGRRLKIARGSARLTQASAAKDIGVARTTLVAIERGNRKVSSQELVDLCKLYDVSCGQMLRKEAIHIDLSPQFRRLPSLENDDGTLSATRLLQYLATRSVELERELGKPLRPNYPPVFRLGSGRLEEQAEDLALELRSHLGIGLSPVPDPVALIEAELGIRIFMAATLPSRISGAYAYAEAIDACILINANHAPARQAWTVIHELGHFMADRSSVDVFQGELAAPSQEERFANLFAAAFLMPAAAVRKRYREIHENQGGFSARGLIYLTAAFHVSLEAMSRRLEQLQLLASGTYEMLKERGLNAQTVREVLGQAPDSARPYLSRHALIALEAYEKELISEGELAKMLCMGRVEVRELLDSVQALSDSLRDSVSANRPIVSPQRESRHA
ncbi:MAG: ImmA/IrrE family metallo-endopeptidase [Gammaproteobacteria bacterium]|nr:ImmA/IrrE family metallo-endopeptidase [Gammaproteobacteria bacterium]